MMKKLKRKKKKMGKEKNYIFEDIGKTIIIER